LARLREKDEIDLKTQENTEDPPVSIAVFDETGKHIEFTVPAIIDLVRAARAVVEGTAEDGCPICRAGALHFSNCTLAVLKRKLASFEAFS
jgi:hypothetical protein